MKIETKLNENDAVFFISNKKVVDSIVRGVTIERLHKKTTITYLCNKDKGEQRIHIKVEEEDAFRSKEELLKSL